MESIFLVSFSTSSVGLKWCDDEIMIPILRNSHTGLSAKYCHCKKTGERSHFFSLPSKLGMNRSNACQFFIAKGRGEPSLHSLQLRTNRSNGKEHTYIYVYAQALCLSLWGFSPVNIYILKRKKSKFPFVNSIISICKHRQRGCIVKKNTVHGVF